MLTHKPIALENLKANNRPSFRAINVLADFVFHAALTTADLKRLGTGILFRAPAASVRAAATSSRFRFFEAFTMRQFPPSSFFMTVTLIECWK